jgi:hypothetical protein
MKTLKDLLQSPGTMTRFLVLAAFAAAISQTLVFGQEAMRTVDQNYEFDEKGDAKIEYDFQLSAAQWAKWKDQYGDHPDILLRDTKYQLASAVIDDFSLEKDEVHRRAVAKIKARALARYRGDGQFEIQVPKNLKLVAGSGREWAFTTSGLEQGGLVNMTSRAKLPTNAQNAHMTSGNDFDDLVYSLDVSPSKPKTFLYLGIVFLLASAGVGAIAFRTPAKASA